MEQTLHILNAMHVKKIFLHLPVFLSFGLGSADLQAMEFALKMQTCEVLLGPQLEPRSSPGSLNKVYLRKAGSKLRGKVRGDLIDAGANYEPQMLFYGLDELPPDKAERALARINGLYVDVTSSDLDTQRIVRVFRGDKVKEALDDYHKAMRKNESMYREQLAQFRGNWPVTYMASKLVEGASLYLTAYLFLRTAESYIYDLPNLASNILYLLHYGALISALPLYHEADRRDLKLASFLSSVESLSERNDPNAFFLYSMNTKFGADFVRGIFSSSGPSESDREETLIDQGNSLVTRLGFQIRDSGLVVGYSDPRFVAVDHIAFLDPETSEPVWIVALRSFRELPAGRPPKRRSVEKVESVWRGLPGLGVLAK